MEKINTILKTIDKSILELKKIRDTKKGVLRKKYTLKIKSLYKEKKDFEWEILEIKDALSQTLVVLAERY